MSPRIGHRHPAEESDPAEPGSLPLLPRSPPVSPSQSPNRVQPQRCRLPEEWLPGGTEGGRHLAVSLCAAERVTLLLL